MEESEGRSSLVSEEYQPENQGRQCSGKLTNHDTSVRLPGSLSIVLKAAAKLSYYVPRKCSGSLLPRHRRSLKELIYQKSRTLEPILSSFSIERNFVLGP